MRASAPCKDCENRQIGCHSSCKLYKDFETARAAELKMIRDAKTERWAAREVQIEGIYRAKTAKGKLKNA